MSRLGSRTDLNRSAILAHLGASGPSSRAELARALSVSPALVTQLTKDLVTEGLIEELDQQPSQGGRPGRRLGLASRAGRAVGVKIAEDHLVCVEVRLDGAVLRSASEPFDARSSTFLASLAQKLERFIAGGDGSAALGVGIGIPGTVDAQDSGIVDSTQLGWQQIPLGASLRRELGLPVIVENNVSALAVAERLYGFGRRHEDFFVVTIGSGIGGAAVIGGVVNRGSTGGAGELGQVPAAHERDGAVVTGPLESFIGEQALVQRAREQGIIGPDAGIAALSTAALAGSRSAVELFGYAGHLLGTTMAGVIHLLDPEAVIVSGEGTVAWEHWEIGFEPAFRSALMPQLRGIPVQVESWQDEGWARGAAALVLASPFDAAGVAGREGRLIRERLVEQSSPTGGTA